MCLHTHAPPFHPIKAQRLVFFLNVIENYCLRRNTYYLPSAYPPNPRSPVPQYSSYLNPERTPCPVTLAQKEHMLTHLLAAHPSAGHLEVIFTQAIGTQGVMRASLKQGSNRLL
jgi:hypothetical protein